MTRPAPIKDPRAAFIKQSVSDSDRARLRLDESRANFDLEAAERILATLISIAPHGGVVQEAMPVMWATIVSHLARGKVPTTPADFESLLHLVLGTYPKRILDNDEADRELIRIPRAEQDRIKRIKKEAKAAGLDLENKWDFEELRALDPADRQNLWPVFTEFDEGVRTREEIDEATWSAAGESWVPAAPGMEAIKKKRHRVFLQRLAEVGGGEFNVGLRNEAAVSLGYTTKSGQNWVREIKAELDRVARGQA